MIANNIVRMTDSYKVSHWKQYPPKTTGVFSYLEARRGGEFDEVTFFGLQYILLQYLAGAVVTREKIDEAEQFFLAHFGDASLFNRAGWEHILLAHDGHLPVIIRAVPEGTTVPTGNVLMTIENTDPECFWLVNYLETLLMQVWYPSTVCTQSRFMKKTIGHALQATGCSLDGLPFKLHDFGYRGSTSNESAGIGGCAHLVNFMGTDTLAALDVAVEHYMEPMAGFSIPAAEHSTITTWGDERAAYENMLDQYPTGLVAVVSDSYDIFNAAEHIWGEQLRDKVLFRDGTLVIRPDSGDPSRVVRKLLTILQRKFGSSMTPTGHITLNPKVRLIQGDGIDRHTLSEILRDMMNEGWSADNIAFGSGGGLLQKVNRDTLRFAMKCSAVEVKGAWHDVRKHPATDPSKDSKAGRLILANDGTEEFITAREGQGANLLNVVFKNGFMPRVQTLADVRMRARENLLA
jgi:nicotinamide phosphoribosyltransferase